MSSVGSAELLTRYAQLGHPAEVATEVVGLTERWVQNFQAATGEHTATNSEFVGSDAVLWPRHLPKPLLRVTPRLYSIEPFSDVPYVEGHLKREPRTEKDIFARYDEDDGAFYAETPLHLAPKPISFYDYDAGGCGTQSLGAKRRLAS